MTLGDEYMEMSQQLPARQIEIPTITNCPKGMYIPKPIGYLIWILWFVPWVIWVMIDALKNIIEEERECRTTK